MKTLISLNRYMGKRKALLPGAILLSGFSSLLGMVPFLCIWSIVRLLLQGEINSYVQVLPMAQWAFVTAIGSVLLYFLALTLSHLAAFRVETRIRSVSMRQIIGMPLGFFDSTTIGKIRKIIDTNASITHGFLAHSLPDMAGTILVPISILILLFVFDWRLGIASLIPILAALFLMTKMMSLEGKKFMQQYMNALEEMNTEAVEYVRGIPVVKVFQQTVFSFKNFHNSIRNYKNMVTAYTKAWEKSMSLYLVLIHGVAFFLVPTGLLIISYGGVTAKVMQDLLLYVLITPLFAQCIMRSAYLGQSLGQATEADNRLTQLMQYPRLTLKNEERKLNNFDISFNKVSFTYTNADQPAVNNVSFSVLQGTTTALVGPSGSGKTTLARLVPRFWDVHSGEVLIGGVSVKEFSYRELMNNISFVFQNTRLFKTTLRQNLLYGNALASQCEIDKALEASQCLDILQKLPQGLETVIGSDGVYLSGGEQQRLILARAMLKNAPIVILDEATAFADPENEFFIQQALSKLMLGKTVLMIAHRLTSVQNADQILVIENGKILEKGNHQSLLDNNQKYAKMWYEYQKSVNWNLKERDD